MIRYLPLTVVLLAVPAVAHARVANKRAEAEARSFLSPCHQPDQRRQDNCKQNQSDFIETYLDARSGDLSSMRMIAADFVASITGMPRDQVQACAWRLAVAQLAARVELAAARLDAQTTCGSLSSVGLANAQHRADRILQELQTEPDQQPKFAPSAGLTTTAVPFKP